MDADELPPTGTCDLITVGRHSGQRRRVEIWYVIIDEQIVLTGTPGARHWLANLREHPEAILHLRAPARDLAVAAREVTDPAARRRVAEGAWHLQPWYAEQGYSIEDWVNGSPMVVLAPRVPGESEAAVVVGSGYVDGRVAGTRDVQPVSRPEVAASLGRVVLDRSAAGGSAPAGVRGPSAVLVFGAGAGVGLLGGLIGLGGAEFRLPLLIALFGFAALQAVIVNKAMSLAVVVTALPARLAAVPLVVLVPHWPVAVNLLAGSLVGAWAGASWATRMRAATLHRVLAGLLVLMAVALVWTHLADTGSVGLVGPLQVVAGLVAGFGIGVVAAVMGVAGGELLIPTLVLLYGVDVKVAGSLSLAISLPTMLVAFARYSRDRSFVVLRRNARFVLIMVTGSVAGTLAGGLLLGAVPDLVLIPALAVLLVLSAGKLWRH